MHVDHIGLCLGFTEHTAGSLGKLDLMDSQTRWCTTFKLMKPSLGKSKLISEWDQKDLHAKGQRVRAWETALEPE